MMKNKIKKIVFLISVVVSLILSTNLAFSHNKNQRYISPFQFNLCTPASLPYNIYSVEGIRINTLYGVNPKVYGLDIGLVNKTLLGSNGIQIGLCNIYGIHYSGGLSISAIYSSSEYGKYKGVCISTFMNIMSDYNGIQISSFLNNAKTMKGVQISACGNYADNLNGIQISGGVAVVALVGAIAGAFTGNADAIKALSSIGNLDAEAMLLFSKSLLNGVNNRMNGIQIGLINSANKINGCQVGLINVASKLSGMQLGLINVVIDGRPHFIPIINISNSN